jgi:hypothetical protein
MASGSEDEIEGAWYFESNQYDPQSSSESEEEPQQNIVEQQGAQEPQHNPRISNEMRHLIFQELLSLHTNDKLPHGTFQRIGQKYGYHHRTIRRL